jgi:1-acyl-sn-glycerol-3-phosphate acyltransferase
MNTAHEASLERSAVTETPTGSSARRLLRRLVRRAFLRAGWRFIGERPALRACVLVAAPHTSYWDLFYMLGVALVFDIRLCWLAKHTVFWWPLGSVFRRLGGIPVDRRAPGRMVEQLATRIRESEDFMLVVAPEGSRGRRDHWRSGFYHIARAAQVPIVPIVLDFGRKETGVGPTIVPTGDCRADMDRIRAFYAGRTGLRPEDSGPIRLREEG